MKELPIVYENKEILIVNKPAGLAVQGGQGVKNPLDQLLGRQLGTKVYPVHRLDKETSGLLVVARTSAAAGLWTRLIASGQVKKEYQALCFGLVKGLKAESALGKTGRLAQQVRVAGEGKSAETFYRVARIFSLEPRLQLEPCLQLGSRLQQAEGIPPEVPPQEIVSLLELTLGTGRTHQIRIHLSQAGCPILADDKHGNFKLNKAIRKSLGIKTLQLAATRLTLPLDGRPAIFQVPLPPHIASALEALSQVGEG